MKNKHTQIVVCALIHSNKKYLLSKRSEKDPDDPSKHLWQIPGGGLHFGERLIDGVRREIKEELNVKINIERLLSIEEEVRRDQWHGIMILYLCTLQEGQTIKLNHEATEFGWFTFEEAKKLHSFKETEKVIKIAEEIHLVGV